MARPLWFRLFGSNASATFAELRGALLTAPIGAVIGEGSLLTRLQSMLQWPGDFHRPLQGPALDVGAQAGLVVATMIEHDLAATPALGAAASTAADHAATAEANSARSASVYLNGMTVNQSLAGGAPQSPLGHLDLSVPYMILGDLQSGLVIDTRTKTLLTGGPGDYPELGAGPNDTVALNGDYSAGFALGTPDFVEQVIVRAGNDYNLIADDSSVAAGRTLTINAMPLGSANSMIFDGSAETDGRFIFYGSDARDVFFGGAGDDIIYGNGGGDILSGGGGSDTFEYLSAAQSSGAGYDVLADFDPAVDKIDLNVTVTGFDAAIQSGSLSIASFDADLGAALASLGAGKAVFYVPDAGDLAGTIFLVVDANGVAGYQEGEDYVFALPATTLGSLAGHTDFFI